MVRILFFSAALWCMLFSCSDKKSWSIENYPSQPLVANQVYIVRVQDRVTDVLYSDIFPDGFTADSVRCDQEAVIVTAIRSGVSMMITDKAPPVSELEIFKDGFKYSLPVLKSDLQDVTVSLNSVNLPQHISPEKVQIAGAFNDWNPQASFMTRSRTDNGDMWQSTLRLLPGIHPYQIVINDQWMPDPGNADSMDNNVGGFNSILTVEGPDPIFLKPIEFDGKNILFTSDRPCKVMAFMDYIRIPAVQTDDSYKIVLPQQSLEGRHTITLLGYDENSRSNDLRIGIQNGKVNSIPESRADKHGMTMYFTLVDRFADGDTTNNMPLDDSRVAPRANYQGGDLEGIKTKLDYIKDLGCNTIWLSPITQNPLEAYREYPEPRRWYSGYHGYWPILYTKVDHRFGDRQSMQGLVETAHSKDMNILLDFVCNHVHEKHPVYQQHPDWATELILPDGRYNIRIWEAQRLTTWFDDFLPTIDFSNPEAVDLVTDSALFWLTEYGIDGFRHDATKHVPEIFWRTLTAKMRAAYPDELPYQIGETFGTRPLIASYLSPGMMEAQFDFPLYFATRSVLTSDQGSFETLETELNASLSAFGHHHLMGNITGNHDMARFISLAGGAIKPGEDDKAAGWERDIGAGDPIAYFRTKLLIAFQCAIPGIPVVYYGDEIGMPGAGDPDSRRMMKFQGLSPEQTAVQSVYSTLLNFRTASSALMYGTTELVESTANLMIIRRSWFDEEVVVVLYKGNQDLQWTLPDPALEWKALFDGKQGISQNGGQLVMEPHSFEYFYRQKK